MSNGEIRQGGNIDPRQYAEALTVKYQTVLEEARNLAYPEAQNFIDAFPEPTQPRDQAPDPDWDQSKETRIRQLVGEFGYGRETDRTLGELGLRGAHVIFEGGQPHKIVAEVAIVAGDAEATPSSYIFCASPNRKIENESEIASARKQLGFVPATEYDVVRSLAKKIKGFRFLDQGNETLALSYDISNQFAVGHDKTGQFIQIGHVDDAPVVLLRIDRQDYADPVDGKKKYRNQPGPADIMRIISQGLELQGDLSSPLAYVTSATYQPSREIEAVRAGLATDRVIGVPTYGIVTLAKVKGESVPSLAPVNQIPGELHTAAKSVEKLAQEIS